MAQLTLNAAAINQALALAAKRAQQGAVAAYGEMDERLKRGERSGVWYPGEPAQSSAPGEDPQEQTGEFRASLRILPVGSFKWAIGVPFNVKNKGLEFKPFALGGRKPFGRAYRDPKMLRAILEAMQ
jgi:hypothetical protein